MGCYVDTVRSYPGAGLRSTEFCHLLADDRDELHELAARVGMPRRFFQDHPWRWHYDLPEQLRVEAIRLGAREVDLAFVGRMLRDRRRSVCGPAVDAGSGATAGSGAPAGPAATVGAGSPTGAADRVGADGGDGHAGGAGGGADGGGADRDHVERGDADRGSTSPGVGG